MQFKRLFATFVIVALTFFPLTLVSAHPGHTDSKGGHTDSDTGDYHYHHGYEAHAHFDMDGNGTTDCPYDFDDQTDRSPGTRSRGDYTPGDGSEDGYQEGYADGYEKGYEEGEMAGWTDGYKTAASEFEKALVEQEEEYARQLQEQQERSDGESMLLLLGLFFFFALFSISYALLRSQDSRYKADLETARDDCNKTADRLSGEYAAYISRLKEAHASELRRLRSKITNFKRLEVLELIAQSKDDSIQLPEGVALRPSYTPIRGKTSKRYPYGSYTIFMTATGKTYHCLHDCVPNARPSHFFDRPHDSTPCRKCVPLDTYPQDLPDWYTLLREKVESIVPDETVPNTPRRLSPAADDQIRFSLDDPQIQFSLKES